MQDNVVHHAPESADEPTEGAALDPRSGFRGEQKAVTEGRAREEPTAEGLQDTERNPSHNAPKAALQPTEGLQDTERNPSDFVPNPASEPTEGAVRQSESRSSNPELPAKEGLQDTERNPSHNAPKAALQPTEGLQDTERNPSDFVPKPPSEPTEGLQNTEQNPSDHVPKPAFEPAGGGWHPHDRTGAGPAAGGVRQSESRSSNPELPLREGLPANGIAGHGSQGQFSNAAVADLHDQPRQVAGQVGQSCGEERAGRSDEVRDSSSSRSRAPQPWEQRPLLPPSRANSRPELPGVGPILGKDVQRDLATSLPISAPSSQPCVAKASGQMSSGAMAPDMPASMETAEDRRWVVQGTIQSVPPVREASPRRSASPAVRPSEARPFYDLMREMRDMMSTPLQPPAPPAQLQVPARRSGAPGAGALPPGSKSDSPREPEAPQKVSKPSATSKSVEVQAELSSRDFTREQLQHQDFRSKLQGARQLLPELRARRRDLDSAIQAIEARSGELRQRCAEAEREALEDFEVMRNHLNSVESLKQAVLSRERDVRLRLAGQIEEFCQRLVQADGSNDASAAAALRAEFPDLHAAADVLCSRACSLPQVEVPIDDVPFEARARSDKLRRYVVAERLLKARDTCLWRREQQRRQLAAETAEGAEWIRHLGSMLDRYAEELGYVCYFCSERFTAAAANTRCGWNQPTSPSGRALSPDRRVPQHLSGSGAHFWVPLPSPASAAAAAAVAGTGPDFREHHAFQQHWASAQVPLPPPPPPPPWVEFPEAWAPPPPQVSSGSRAASPSATRYGGQSFAGPTAPRRELAAFGQAGPGGAGDVPVPVSRGPAAFVERRCGGGGPLPAAEARSGDLLAVLRGREEAEGFALV
ncbi:unnamed protein product [Symbiodinium microadriaticum]|nr:unnamed protein product [Symbiodinium microadriaticum]